MKRYFVYLFFYSFISCHLSVEDKVYNSGIHIIPEPLQLEVRQGVFPVSNSTTLSLENGDWEKEASILMNKLEEASGYKLSFRITLPIIALGSKRMKTWEKKDTK